MTVCEDIDQPAVNTFKNFMWGGYENRTAEAMLPQHVEVSQDMEGEVSNLPGVFFKDL